MEFLASRPLSVDCPRHRTETGFIVANVLEVDHDQALRLCTSQAKDEPRRSWRQGVPPCATKDIRRTMAASCSMINSMGPNKAMSHTNDIRV